MLFKVEIYVVGGFRTWNEFFFSSSYLNVVELPRIE